MAVLLVSFLVVAAAARPAWAAGDEREKIVAPFNYPATLPLNAEVKLIQKIGSYTQYRVDFDSTNGERVPAFFYLPAAKKAPYPCIIVQHGYGGDKNMGGSFAPFYAQKGFAAISIDIEYHGDRKQAGKDVLSTDVEDDARALKQTVIDLKRTVDYLYSRGDIDTSRIGYIGASLGSFLGSVFVGVDPRVAAAVFVVGGGDWEEMIAISKVAPFDGLRASYAEKKLPYSDYDKKMDVVEPLNYIGLISPRPLYMINCSNDKYVPKPTAEKLFAAAREPKKIDWYVCDGEVAHIPPMDKVITISRNWFKAKFSGK